MNNKAIIEFGYRRIKNYADLGGSYPPLTWASGDNTLLDLQNSSYPTQPHSKLPKTIGLPLPLCICMHNGYAHVQSRKV